MSDRPPRPLMWIKSIQQFQNWPNSWLKKYPSIGHVIAPCYLRSGGRSATFVVCVAISERFIADFLFNLYSIYEYECRILNAFLWFQKTWFCIQIPLKSTWFWFWKHDRIYGNFCCKEGIPRIQYYIISLDSQSRKWLTLGPTLASSSSSLLLMNSIGWLSVPSQEVWA